MLNGKQHRVLFLTAKAPGILSKEAQCISLVFAIDYGIKVRYNYLVIFCSHLPLGENRV